MAGRSVTGAKPGWKVLFVDSQETSGENAPGVAAIDGDPDTFWHTRWADESPPHPHEIRIDMGAEREIGTVGILPRAGNQSNGTIDGYELYLSNDPQKWGEPASKGNFGKAGGERKVKLAGKTKARYLRLVALSEINGQPWTSVAEIAVYP